jgi:hypothetical protein
MDTTELFRSTMFLRRNFPRNNEFVDHVLSVCEGAEWLAIENAALRGAKSVVNTPSSCSANTADVNAVVNATVRPRAPTARSDMAAYMRAYRARKRSGA